MSRSFRRFLPFGVAAVVLVSLSACASETTAPSSQSVGKVNAVCETQGSNNRC